MQIPPTPPGAVDALDVPRQAVCVTTSSVDEFRIEHANQTLLDIFCFESHQCIGRSLLGLGRGPLTSRTTIAEMSAALGRGVSVRAQTISHRSDGEPFRLRWSVDPMFDDAGRVVRCVGVLADVTEDDRLRKRLIALDSLTRSLRAVAGPADGAIVAASLIAAVSPMVDQIGSARAFVGPAHAPPNRSVWATTASSGLRPRQHRALAAIPIGRHGTIEISAYPDAVELVDVAAIRELADQVAWSIDVLGGLRSDAGDLARRGTAPRLVGSTG